jgi:Glutathione S-transferase, C-terminal domain
MQELVQQWPQIFIYTLKFSELAAHFYETDEAVKQKKLDVALNETAPFYFGKLEEIAKTNNGYFANGKVTEFL